MNEPKNQLNQPGCDCGDNCCPPKKEKPYKMIVFGVVLLAAAAIIGIKLLNGLSAEKTGEPCCPKGTEACCDSTSADTTKTKSCCP